MFPLCISIKKGDMTTTSVSVGHVSSRVVCVSARACSDERWDMEAASVRLGKQDIR